jgi:hypothetical protein
MDPALNKVIVEKLPPLELSIPLAVPLPEKT